MLGTASLYGWRGIKALRQVLRAGTAGGLVAKACYNRIIEKLFGGNLLITCRFLGFFLVVSRKKRNFGGRILII